MPLTNKLDIGVPGTKQGRGPYGGSLAIPEEDGFQHANAGDEQCVRGNTFAFVRFGVDVERGDVVMFDEMYGEKRVGDNDNFTSDADVPNGAQKISNTWGNGARTVMLGVVAASYKKGDYGWVVRRGRWIVKIKRDTSDSGTTVTGVQQAFGANEGPGFLSERDSGAYFYGFSFNDLTAASANDQTDEVVADIVFPHGKLGDAAAAVAQPNIDRDPVGRPTNQ